MIKLAICDDEIGVCTQLENLIIKILKNYSIKYDIDIFYTGERLCDKLKEETYDLLFLDIELPNSTGINVGEYIRQTLKNDIIEIAYISAKTHYANALFDFRPINFLHKPLTETDVKKVLDTYIRIKKFNEQTYTYQKGRNLNKIPIDQILYFESLGRKVKMFTLNNEIEFYENMENLYEEVKKYKFLYIHKSYIINSRYIKDIEYNNITLINDQILPISQTKRKEVREIYSKISRELF